MIIDNFSVLKSNLEFSLDGTYYVFMALCREKDGLNILTSTNTSTNLKTWIVDSKSKLEELQPIMQHFCDLTGARLYYTVDRKSTLKTMNNMLKNLTETVIQQSYSDISISINHLSKLFNHCAFIKESNSDKEHRYWFIDCDSKRSELFKAIYDFLGGSYIYHLDTPSGYHFVAKKNFDKRKFEENLEDYLPDLNKKLINYATIKENAFGLAYYNIDI